MLGSRNDVRWSCILHPDGELEKAPTFISTHHNTASSVEHMGRDQRGDQDLRVGVSNLAWSSNGWKECVNLALKKPDLYESVCGNYTSVRNARTVIRVPVIKV